MLQLFQAKQPDGSSIFCSIECKATWLQDEHNKMMCMLLVKRAFDSDLGTYYQVYHELSTSWTSAGMSGLSVRHKKKTQALYS